MNELESSISAIGANLDEETAIATLAYRFYEEEGRPEGMAEEHWLRAERELRRRSDISALSPVVGKNAEEL